MDEPILVKYLFTVEEVSKGLRYNLRWMLPTWLRAAMSVFVFGLCFAPGDKQIPDVISSSILALIFFFFLPKLLLWTSRRRLTNRPEIGTEIEWRITLEKIATKSVIGASEVNWRTFTKGASTPNGLLLCSNHPLFYWLPRNGFASDLEFNRAIEILKAKVPKFIEMS